MGVYTINDEVVVDRVLRFENLSAELEAVRRQLNIPEPLELPRAKARFRKDKRTAGEILTTEEKARIAQIFEKEISLYGYEI